MVKGTFFKYSARSISGSPGRFIAIFAIVALGVGFLAGLLVTTPDMRHSVDVIYDDTSMADVRIVANLGLSQDDVNALSQVEGVEFVVPAMQVDAEVMMQNGTETATRFHSIDIYKEQSDPGFLNRPMLIEGQWPTEPGHCLVERNIVLDDSLKVGDIITIDPESDAADGLLRLEYEVVGIVTSGYYLSAENRGQTTVGNGLLESIAYIDISNFDGDIYSEIFLTIEGAKEQPAFSEQYDSAVEGIIEALEDFSEVQKYHRRDDIIAEVNDELSNAERELEASEINGQKELDEIKAMLDRAQSEYDDGLLEYQDGVAEYEDGLLELSDARDELAQGYIDFETEIGDAQAELDDAKLELDEAWADLQQAWTELLDGRDELDEALFDIEEGRAELQDAKIELQDALLELEDGQREIDEGWDEVRDARDQINAGWSEYNTGVEQLTALGTGIGGAKTAYDADNIGQADIFKATLRGALDAFRPEMTPEQVAGIEILIDNGLFYDNPSTADVANDGAYYIITAMLDTAFSELDDARIALENAYDALDDGRDELEQAELDLQEGWDEYNDGLAEYEDGLAEFLEGEREYIDGLTEYEEGYAEYQDGLAEYGEGKAEYEEGLLEFETEKADALQELADAEIEISDAEIELSDAKIELEEAEIELADAKIELEDGILDYNDGVIEFEKTMQTANDDLTKARDKADDVDQPEWYVLGRDSFQSYVSYDGDTEKVAAISTVFPIFFFAVAALVSSTTMTRSVEEGRVQIGTLKALGYSNGAITAKYLGYAGAAAVLGSVVGLAGGLYLLPRVVYNAYKLMYNLPPMVSSDHRLYSIIASGVIMLAILLSTYLALRGSLIETAASLMRPKAPPAGKRIVLEYITPLWRRMRFTHKVTARNLLRYKKRFFMTVVGISGCTALLVTGFGLRDSISDIVDVQYKELHNYDMSMYVEHEGDQQSDSRISNVLNGEAVSEYMLNATQAGTASKEGIETSVFVVVPESADLLSEFITFRDRRSGQTVEFSENGALLTEKAAAKLGLSIGDSFTLELGDYEQVQVTVTGIVENYVMGYLYLAPGVHEQLYGELPEFTGVYARTNADDEASRDAIAEQLLSSPNVSAVDFSSVTIDTFETMLQSIDYIVVVLILCASALALIVLYNLTNINITERQKEIATIKVLGFTAKEVSAYIFREIAILSLLGCVVGLFIGVLLHAFVVVTAEVDAVMFGRQIKSMSFVYSVGITGLFTTVVCAMMSIKLRAIDMVESLKAPE